MREVGIVGGRIAAERAAVEIEDAGGEVAQEAPVVRDEDQRAAPVLQRLLEMTDGVDVEMVGGLVEDQQVRVAHQRGRQQDATLGAGGKRFERCREVQLQIVRRLIDARLDFPRHVASGRSARLVKVVTHAA